MKTVAIPMGLVGDNTTTSLHIHVAALLALEASSYGWVRISQRSISEATGASQQDIVDALRVLRDKNYLAVDKDEDGMFYRLLWFRTTQQEEPKKYRWVYVRRLGDKGNGGYLRINGGPDDRDELKNWLVGMGYDLLRLHDEPPQKAPS